jgi:UDP-glucose 4-epimerase
MGLSLHGGRWLVTGGRGFIGTHLVERLVKEGAERVLVLDRREAAMGGSRTVVHATHDLGTSGRDSLAEAMQGVDCVFHLAAEKQSPASTDPPALLRANVVGTAEVIEAAAAARVRKVVFTSSVHAYGRRAGPPLAEDDPALPATVYGVSKLAGERLLEGARAETGLSYLALRCFFVYGPGMEASRGYRTVIPLTLARLRRGEPAAMHGDGEQVLDYVFVDDVVEALVRAAVSPASGLVLNVGSGRPTSVNHLLDALLALTGSRAGKTSLAPDATAGTRRVASLERIGSVLEWAPRVGLEEGLARTRAAMAAPGVPG